MGNTQTLHKIIAIYKRTKNNTMENEQVKVNQSEPGGTTKQLRDFASLTEDQIQSPALTW